MTMSRLERQLPDALTELADMPYPDYIDEVLEITARTPRRPAWMFPSRYLPRWAAPFGEERAMPRGVVLALIVALLLAAGLVLAVGSQRRLPSPFGPAGNGAVVYAQDGDLYARADIAVAPRLIAGTAEIESRPLFSRQGDRLLFLRSTPGRGVDAFVSAEVWVANADGSAARRLAGPYTVDRVEWSPDGHDVLIGIRDSSATNLEHSEGRVVVAGIENGSVSLLDLGMDAWSPSWRPAGGHFSFCGRSDGGAWGVFLARADGSEITRLDLAGATVWPDTYEPCVAWSDAGTRLAFAAGPAPGEVAIHVADVDASGAVGSVQMYDFDPSSIAERQPRWMADGDRLIVEMRGSREARLGIASLDERRLLAVMPRAAPPDERVMYEVAPDGTLALVLFPGRASSWRWDFATGSVAEMPLGTSDIASMQRVLR